MEVIEAVRTLLAVQNCCDTPVLKDTLREILEAGRVSANAMNAQPWHFIVVQDRDTLGKLAALAHSARRRLHVFITEGCWND